MIGRFFFVYELNPNIRAMVQMWKPSSIVEVVESACYAKEHMDLKGCIRSSIPQQLGFWGKAPHALSRGEVIGNLLMEIELHPKVAVGVSLETSATSQESSVIHEIPRHSWGVVCKGRGSRGRKSFQKSPKRNVHIPPEITYYGCGGPCY
jgi:hypothetical protein